MKCIAYFQSHTNSMQKTKQLLVKYYEVLHYSSVAGLIIARIKKDGLKTFLIDKLRDGIYL